MSGKATNKARVKAKTAQKSRGGQKRFAAKHTFNPGPGGATLPNDQTREPFEQDRKRRLGQYVGAGEAPIMGHSPDS